MDYHNNMLFRKKKEEKKNGEEGQVGVEGLVGGGGGHRANYLSRWYLHMEWKLAATSRGSHAKT